MAEDADTKIASEKLLTNIYKDGLGPAVQSVGTALGTIFEVSNTFLLPIKQWNEKKKLIFQHNISKFQESLKQATDIGRTVVPAPPEIGTPIVEKLTYISEESLSDLFINLLRRSSIKEEAHLAHPRFVDILSSISPDEARLLKEKSSRRYFRCLSIRWEKTETESSGIQTTNYYYRNSTERCLTGIEFDTLILFPQNIYTYLISLQSLGILVISEDTTLDEADTPYQEYLELTERYKQIAKDGIKRKDGFVSTIIFGRVQFTEFGKLFLKACAISADTDINFDEEIPDILSNREEFSASSVNTQPQTLEKNQRPTNTRKSTEPSRSKRKQTLRTQLKDRLDIVINAMVGSLLTLSAKLKMEQSLTPIQIITEAQSRKILTKIDCSEVSDLFKLLETYDEGGAIDPETLSWFEKSIPIIISRISATEDQQ
jgi:hypothetical protein